MDKRFLMLPIFLSISAFICGGLVAAIHQSLKNNQSVQYIELSIAAPVKDDKIYKPTPLFKDLDVKKIFTW